SHLTVTPDYFRAMGTPLLRGRVFSSRDTKDSPPVIIVNDLLAQRFFPDGNAIGQQIIVLHGENNQPTAPKEIVGVVGGSRHESLATQPLPEFYIPASQDPQRRMYVVIAYTVAQRTREIGIRMALGAQRIDMLTMILRQSFAVIGIGLLAGILGAIAVTRLMSSLLYGVSPTGLSIYLIVTVLLSA